MTLPDGLEARLASPEEEERHGAILGLAGAGAEALAPLAAGLGDPSWRVRKAALELLLGEHGAAAVPRLIAGLRDEENAGRRNSSMEALIRLGPVCVASLAPLLGDPDPDLRKFVVDALGSIEAPEVAPLLRAALEDPDENVSAAAAECLGNRRDAAAVPALLRRLGQGGAWLAFGCLRALGQIGEPAASPAVIAMLGAPGLRRAALEVLGRLGREEAVPHLLEALFCGDRGLRRTAAVAAHRVLERIGRESDGAEALREAVRQRADGEFLDFLRHLLGDEEPAVRAAAAALLGLAPGPEAIGVILEALPRAGEQDQEVLARVLEELPEPALPRLIPRLLDRATQVRLQAARVLGRRRCREAVPALLPLLEDATGHVRSAAAGALGAIGDAVAVAPLVALLRDPYPDVRKAGRDAIVAIGAAGEPQRGLVTALLEPHLGAPEEEFAAGVIRILGRLGAEGLTARIGAALRDARGEVRRAAAEALGAIGGPQAAQALRVALTDEDVAVRREAVVRLGQIGDPAGLPLLAPMLQDDDLWVRVRTIQALAGIAHPEARRILLAAAATEPPGPKRLAAIRALGQARIPEGLTVLTGLAEAPDRETRMAAVEALGALADTRAVTVVLGRLADPEWGLRVAAVKALAPFALEDRVRAALAEAARADADALVRSSAAEVLAGAAPA